MDAFSLIPMERTDGFWIGVMSARLGEAAAQIDAGCEKDARKDLRATLAEFIASPVPSEQLRSMLRPYLGGKK